MFLSGNQKKFIKKNVNKKSLKEISRALNLPESEIIKYLEERWSKEKIAKYANNPSIEEQSKKNDNFPPDISIQKVKSFLSHNWLYFLYLGLLVFTIYANSFLNGFVSDDIALIVKNNESKNFSYVTDRLVYFVQPLVFFLIQNLWGGTNPFFFRLPNYLSHYINTILIFILISIFKNRRSAFITAALFAVHPILVETVVWITADIYCWMTTFYLISFLLYLFKDKNRYFYYLSLFFFVLTVTNVRAMALAFSFPLYEFCFGNLKKNWKLSIPYIIIFIACILQQIGPLFVRIKTLGMNRGGPSQAFINPLLLIPVSTATYLSLIFWPKDLSFYQSEFSLSLIKAISLYCIFFVYLGTLLISFRKNKYVFFWLSIFILSLLPYFTPLKIAWIVAERYIYLGTIGIIAVTVAFFDKIFSGKNLKILYYFIVGIIIILLSVRTITRNIDWQDEDHLWIATAKTAPSDPKTHNNMGDYYSKRNDLENSVKEFTMATKLDPAYAEAYHNLAVTYTKMGKIDDAISNYQKAIKLNPRLIETNQNLSAIYFNQKNYTKSYYYAEKSLELDPQNPQLKENIQIVKKYLNSQ